MQAFSKVLSHHGHGVKPCLLCDVPVPIDCLLDHSLKDHHVSLKLGDYLLKVESLLSLWIVMYLLLIAKFTVIFTNTLHVILLFYVIIRAPLWVISMNI